MAKYLYQARNTAGKIQTGSLEAQNEQEAKLRLQQQQLVPLRLLTAPAAKTAVKSQGFSFGASVSGKEMQVFTRQFATLIQAGIPLSDSLKMLAQGKGNVALQTAILACRSQIETGKTLADAMAQHPKIFNPFFVNMIRSSQETGKLDDILQRLAVYIEKSEKIKKQVVGALTYPAIIIVIALIVISAILFFVIPQFQSLYASSGKELPMITQAVITMSEYLKKKWYVVFGTIIGVFFALKYYIESPDGKIVFDKIMIRAPLFGPLVQKSSVAKMTRTLSTLLSSGVDIVAAIEIASKTAGNAVIEETLLRCKASVVAGKKFSAPLAKEKFIPDMVTQMISMGEDSGNTDAMLGKIADYYEDDVENAVKALTTMIEPLMMVFLGGTIAVLVTAMYLPIFSMASL